MTRASAPRKSSGTFDENKNALAETTALLVLSKQLQAIFHAE